jgi:hypothetical protein
VREELAAVSARYLAGLVVVLGSAQFALSTHTWTTAAAATDKATGCGARKPCARPADATFTNDHRWARLGPWTVSAA